MIEKIRAIFQIPELKAKILITTMFLLACRLGTFVPVPGINAEMAETYFRFKTGGGQNLFQLVDVFSGGAFSQMTVTALGVMPYITASIVMQLLVALIPSFQREMKENQDYARRKIGRYTRFATLCLAMFQSGLYAKYALQLNYEHPGIVLGQILDYTMFGAPYMFYLTVMVTMTTGTLLLMWVGEQITEKGIGNGMSLIITVGILSSFPSTLGLIIQQLNLDSQQAGQLSFATLLVLMAVFVAVILFTILLIQGQRKIPLQYARRVVGRRETQGGTAFLPLKVNYAGVIPVIFASSLLMFPATVGQFVSSENWLSFLARTLYPGSTAYTILYVLLILFFSYFWTATQFHPEQIASDMKKNGAFIPGIRQGRPTQDYLESTMNRITLIGAVGLATLAIFPQILAKMMSVDPTISYFFGGTSLLIMVGVVLDTTKQLDSHLMMKRYDGFMRRPKIRVKA